MFNLTIPKLFHLLLLLQLLLYPILANPQNRGDLAVGNANLEGQGIVGPVEKPKQRRRRSFWKAAAGGALVGGGAALLYKGIKGRNKNG